jgi:hypothetical protein
MSTGSEGESGSYEEQYAAFARKQQATEQQHKQQDLGLRQIDDAPKHPISGYEGHPIRNDSRSRSDFSIPREDQDRRAQEALEMAFLEFISCYPTKNVPPMGFQEPPEQHSPEHELYDDISTSPDFEAFGQQHTNAAPRRDEDFEDDSATGTAAPASLSTESSALESFTEDGISYFTDTSMTSNSVATESTDIHDTDKAVLDGAASKSSFLPAFTSYLENLANENTSRDDSGDVNDSAVEPIVDIGNVSDSAVEPTIDIGDISDNAAEPTVESGNVDDHVVVDSGDVNDSAVEPTVDSGNVNDSAPESTVDAPNSESYSKPEEKYYTVEVRVETTFPTGITVESAKKGWLEFCWARGGGIVVPAESSPIATSPPASKTRFPDDAPATIKFERKKSNDEEIPETKSKVEERSETESSDNNQELVEFPTGIPSSRELLVPFGLKQELVSSTSTLDEGQADTIRRDVVTYKTTQRGFFCRDMVQDTHEGRVEFIGASYTSTRMIWTVKFEVEDKENDAAAKPKSNEMPTTIRSQGTTAKVMEFASTTKTMVDGYSKQFLDCNPGLKTMMSKANLWGSWSQLQLKTASQNLIAYLDNSVDSIPVLEHTETLPVGVSPREAMEAWYDYYWKNGGGSVPVVSSAKKDSDIRWTLPTGLEEELVSLEYDHPVSESGAVGVDGTVTTETEIAKAVYRVNNPNLLTYPVYENRATVRFVRDGEANPTQLFWKVRVKPYRKFLGGGVTFFTKNGIVLAARNLRKYIELLQLGKREIELQAQLGRLRSENPKISTDNSSTEKNDGDNDDWLPLEGFKTIRSTFSISTGPSADAANEEKEKGIFCVGNIDDDSEDHAAENDGWKSAQEHRNTKRSTIPAFAKDAKTRPTITPLHDEGKITQSEFDTPRNINDDRATMPIDDGHTQPIKDDRDEDAWQ